MTIDHMAEARKHLDDLLAGRVAPDPGVTKLAEAMLPMIKVMKPWDEMTEAEQKAFIANGVAFICDTSFGGE